MIIDAYILEPCLSYSPSRIILKILEALKYISQLGQPESAVLKTPCAAALLVDTFLTHAPSLHSGIRRLFQVFIYPSSSPPNRYEGRKTRANLDEIELLFDSFNEPP